MSAARTAGLGLYVERAAGHANATADFHDPLGWTHIPGGNIQIPLLVVTDSQQVELLSRWSGNLNAIWG